jgi:hypothetical protein
MRRPSLKVRAGTAVMNGYSLKSDAAAALRADAGRRLYAKR